MNKVRPHLLSTLQLRLWAGMSLLKCMSMFADIICRACNGRGTLSQLVICRCVTSIAPNKSATCKS